MKTGAKLALLSFAIIIIVVIVFLLLSPVPQGSPQALDANATAHKIEFGRAGDYGYVTFYYIGSGNASLIALNESPKSRIVVLKKDYLNTERYSYFMDALRQRLEPRGFSVTESDSIGSPENSIVIIPSGAMPSDVLARLGNLIVSNKVIYIGKTDLLFSENLVQSDWYSNLPNSSKSRLLVLEKTLDEFYSEKNYSLFTDIERNSWAETNSESYAYSGSGKKTMFVELRNASWLRMLPLADSLALPEYQVEITGKDEVFSWEKDSLTIQMNYTSGTANYSLEKDGETISGGELDRVRVQEAFFLSLSFPSPGDYLLRVRDSSGTIGAKRIHVKNLSVSLANAYGNRYEFLVLLDGKPLEDAPVQIGLSHSNNTVQGEVRNGKLEVLANLRQGENTFLITVFGRQNPVAYVNSQGSIFEFYAKYLAAGAALIAVFYAAIRLNRKPTYKILVPESIPERNPEMRISPKHVIAAIRETERRFGWKQTPLYAKEIALGLKCFTGGMDVTEGNVEALMKRLEAKGLATSHLGLYGLPSWGDQRQNALRRMVRDKLVQNGIEFSETKAGFRCRDWEIIFPPAQPSRDSIMVFGDREEKREFLSSLEGRERASLGLRIANGILRLRTLDELDELL